MVGNLIFYIMNTPNFLPNEQFEPLSFEEKLNYFLEDPIPEDVRDDEEWFPIIYNVVKDLEDEQIHKLSILFMVANMELHIKWDFNINDFKKFYDQFTVNSNIDIFVLAKAYLESEVHEEVAKKLLTNIWIFKKEVNKNYDKIINLYN